MNDLDVGGGSVLAASAFTFPSSLNGESSTTVFAPSSPALRMKTSIEPLTASVADAAMTGVSEG